MMIAVCGGTVGVLTRAADAYQRALSLSPDNADVHGLLGCVYLEQR